MKGDFTRDTFDSRKHFTRVLMQQGRVQIDADWNEQAAILLRYMRALAADLIGPYGGPTVGLGFGMIGDPNAIDALKDDQGEPLDPVKIKSLKASLDRDGFLLEPGHYYVNGLLCENEDYLGFLAQAGQSTTLADLKNATKSLWLVYLDVWERHITALQDARIRETALGGPDTSTRAQITWQVNLLRPSDQKTLQTNLTNLKSSTDAAKVEAAKAELEKLFARERRTQMLPSDALLAARLQPSEQSEDPCIIDPDSVYRGAANQLYRVEIHTGGDAGVATFKWSRDNGSIAAAWLDSEGSDLVVAGAHGFTDRQWVELTDDLRELRGEPGTLVKLAKVEADTLTIDPTSTSEQVSWNQADVHPIVRGWNQLATDAITLKDGAVPVGEGTLESAWIDLENGIQIRFQPQVAGAGAPRQYHTGDYWLIPARVATGGIEWPVQLGADGNPQIDPTTKKSIPLAEPPQGVEHSYAPLAIVLFDNSGKATVQGDLRRRVSALGI